jgi:hypothetical protein
MAKKSLVKKGQALYGNFLRLLMIYIAHLPVVRLFSAQFILFKRTVSAITQRLLAGLAATT